MLLLIGFLSTDGVRNHVKIKGGLSVSVRSERKVATDLTGSMKVTVGRGTCKCRSKCTRLYMYIETAADLLPFHFSMNCWCAIFHHPLQVSDEREIAMNWIAWNSCR